MRALTEQLKRINHSLSPKYSTHSEYDQAISQTEDELMRVDKNSEHILHDLTQKSVDLLAQGRRVQQMHAQQVRRPAPGQGVPAEAQGDGQGQQLSKPPSALDDPAALEAAALEAVEGAARRAAEEAALKAAEEAALQAAEQAAEATRIAVEEEAARQAAVEAAARHVAAEEAASREAADAARRAADDELAEAARRALEEEERRAVWLARARKKVADWRSHQ